jgi:hypothetical protein
MNEKAAKLASVSLGLYKFEFEFDYGYVPGPQLRVSCGLGVKCPHAALPPARSRVAV